MPDVVFIFFFFIILLMMKQWVLWEGEEKECRLWVRQMVRVFNGERGVGRGT